MKLNVTKITIFSVVVAFVALSLFITFSQEEFVTTASINLLVYKTPPFPILVFITATFLTGLLLGLFVAVVDHIQMRSEIKKLKKEVAEKFSSIKDVTAEASVVENIENS